jgi:hypothetical protein
LQQAAYANAELPGPQIQQTLNQLDKCLSPRFLDASVKTCNGHSIFDSSSLCAKNEICDQHDNVQSLPIVSSDTSPLAISESQGLDVDLMCTIEYEMSPEMYNRQTIAEKPLDVCNGQTHLEMPVDTCHSQTILSTIFEDELESTWERTPKRTCTLEADIDQISVASVPVFEYGGEQDLLVDARIVPQVIDETCKSVTNGVNLADSRFIAWPSTTELLPVATHAPTHDNSDEVSDDEPNVHLGRHALHCISGVSNEEADCPVEHGSRDVSHCPLICRVAGVTNTESMRHHISPGLELPIAQSDDGAVISQLPDHCISKAAVMASMPAQSDDSPAILQLPGHVAEENTFIASLPAQAETCSVNPQLPDHLIAEAAFIYAFSTSALAEDEEAETYTVNCAESGSYEHTVEDMVTACSEEERLDGIWSDANGLAVIDRHTLTWHDGVETQLIERTSKTMKLRRDEEMYIAEVKADGHLHWSDGDIWTRKQAHCPVLSQGSQIFADISDGMAAPTVMFDCTGDTLYITDDLQSQQTAS